MPPVTVVTIVLCGLTYTVCRRGAHLHLWQITHKKSCIFSPITRLTLPILMPNHRCICIRIPFSKKLNNPHHHPPHTPSFSSLPHHHHFESLSPGLQSISDSKLCMSSGLSCGKVIKAQNSGGGGGG